MVGRLVELIRGDAGREGGLPRHGVKLVGFDFERVPLRNRNIHSVRDVFQFVDRQGVVSVNNFAGPFAGKGELQILTLRIRGGGD